jgi:hypothetical protein
MPPTRLCISTQTILPTGSHRSSGSGPTWAANNAAVPAVGGAVAVLPPHPDPFTSGFRKVCAKAGVPADTHLHSLRHFQSAARFGDLRSPEAGPDGMDNRANGAALHRRRQRGGPQGGKPHELAARGPLTPPASRRLCWGRRWSLWQHDRRRSSLPQRRLDTVRGRSPRIFEFWRGLDSKRRTRSS